MTNIRKHGKAAAAGLLLLLAICGFFLLQTPWSAQTAAGVAPGRLLIAGGQSVGVQMDVAGVLVVGLEDIVTDTGAVINPGLDAGLQIGDMLLEINGFRVNSPEQVARVVNEVRSTIEITASRKGNMMTMQVSPAYSAADKAYKIGIWVKDKTAGIGTLTFYDPASGVYGALGHGIVDAESGTVLGVEDGVLVRSQVEEVVLGKEGTPGEIHGIFFESEEPLGTILRNTPFGVFGTAYTDIRNPVSDKPMEAASRDQIKKGKAYILTTLEGDQVELYEIEVEKIFRQRTPSTKSMVIRVTDERLLEKSGGIVQGMSGSPVIQNGRIIGAVTHVFVKDPQRGYAIFIEWMLQEAEL